MLSVIQRFSNRKEPVDDLFQIGCIGLIKAMDNFDLSQNVRFSTYAVPMIIGEIRRYLRDNNAIRVSRSLRDTAYKVLQKRNELCAERGEDVPIEDIAKAMEMPVEEVVFALEAIQDPVSLFEPVYHDGNDAMFVMDQVSDEKNKQENWLETIALSQALQQLGRKGTEYHLSSLFQRAHTDGGSRGDRHQPGPGIPPGKMRASSIENTDVKGPKGPFFIRFRDT